MRERKRLAYGRNEKYTPPQIKEDNGMTAKQTNRKMEGINEHAAPTLNVDTGLFYQLVLFNN